MKGPDGFLQAYNAQIAVEPALQLIVGQAVTQQGNDKKQLLPMIEAVKRQSGQKVRAALADSGYCSEENLRAAANKNVDLYVGTGKQKHNQPPPPRPRGPIPKSATPVDRMKRKLRTVAGRAIYARRKVIVEPFFGQIKQAQGFRQFLLRGWKRRVGAGMHDPQPDETLSGLHGLSAANAFKPVNQTPPDVSQTACSPHSRRSNKRTPDRRGRRNRKAPVTQTRS